MEVKVYVPQLVDIPNEYLPALVQRAYSLLTDAARDEPATRGQLVRQAVRDGLLRQFDSLKNEDGSVDLLCEPDGEEALEIKNRTLTLAELYDALQAQKPAWDDKLDSVDQFDNDATARRKAA
ncbi:MAG: hypothetical protein HQ567_00200 [Candidatus Nealsonbacteria bacterium]|nr:hypothetical protein [Candidatus Nealsonbacteria bacterium]